MAMNKARRRVRDDALAQCGRAAVTGFAILLLTGESQAQQAPRELREKSIVLNWSEIRTTKGISGHMSGREFTSRFDATLNLYVSVQGRVFSTFKRVSGRLVYDDSNEISGTGKSLLLWRFQDGALVADQAFARGARRVAISFNDQFNTCSIKVTYGKKGGTEPIIFEGSAPGDDSQYEAIDQKMISTSCSVQQGNIFANPQ
ncbi:MAG: hypothetical protein ABSC25_04760 [Roseiarcus sp.]|jgi:hypothetical protein